MSGVLLAVLVTLTNQFGSVSVETHGARVISYVPAGGSEIFANLSPEWGGVPICWPWFQFNGPEGRSSAKHGIARYREFTLVERSEMAECGRLAFKLVSDEETRKIWPHDFELVLSVRLSSDGLALELVGKNTGRDPFAVTEAFHPYVLRSEISRIRETGSGRFRTWDPMPDSHLKTVGIGPDDWKRFVCVENGTFDARSAYVLKPGESHALSRTFAVDASEKAARRSAEWAAWEPLLCAVKSTMDGSLQPCSLYLPERTAKEPVPLLVGFHTWSFDWKGIACYKAMLAYAKANGWALVCPNFRGANDHPEACGSDLAVQDVVDAIEYAKSRGRIDADRIYATGGSGGGHMTLLMLGRHPEIFAAGAAFCPITDLARWHAESLEDHPGRGKGYAKMMERACGGTPAEKPEEYARRSPLTWLAAVAKTGVPAYIATGIHDGHSGSVPVGQAIRAYNALCNPGDGMSEEQIARIEADERIPDKLLSEAKDDPFYPERMRVHFRRTSGNVRFTLFEGGHAINFPSGFDFLARQRKGAPVDWTISSKARANLDALTK